MTKPLGRRAYGNTPHLPGSRMGPGDHHCHDGQSVICQSKARDKYDRIIITEKLDGSNVAIAKINGQIIALTRAGYLANTSPYEQHHMFDKWVSNTKGLWSSMLRDGDVIHGEWLAQAHGTIYHLHHDPFVAFGISYNAQRTPFDDLTDRCNRYDVVTPYIVSDGPPMDIVRALEKLGDYGQHGAQDRVEGVVYRVERNGKFDFLTKFVIAEKQDGKYLANLNGGQDVWNWRFE